uniref:Extracellular matrix protein 2 n=1 Tax=Cyclopterus lumpus TaxID=8103 RepID=A0A8C3AIU9_CYCLU
MLNGGVNAEGGVDALQTTALSASDAKVQASHLTRRTQQLLQQGGRRGRRPVLSCCSDADVSVVAGKQGQCEYRGLTMFDQAVWSPKPCVTCLCAGGRVVCDEIACPTMHCNFPFTPAGECCPVCMESGRNTTCGNDEARKTRRKQRKEQADKQRKIVEGKRRDEEEALRLQVEKEEEEWRRHMEEEERRREVEEKRRRQDEDDKRQKEAAEREAWEKERKLEEERWRQEEMLREQLLAPVEEEEEEEQKKVEEEVWLRGDVFEMPPKEPEEPEEPEEPDLLPNRGGLPPGCDISDVTLTCDNAKLTYFPPLSIPELKSLSLEGNNISSIPAEAFNGIPNLEWINLKKNKLSSNGIDTNAFKGLKMLRRLYLDGNLLEAVPADLPPTLQELKINENQLRRIDENGFQDLSSLVILELEGNLLSEGNVDPLAFAPLVELSYLRLGRNHFRTIPQGLPSSLLELYLENNLIEEISETVFNQTHSLNVVSLRNNRLDETRIAPLAWINHRNLESIDLSNNDLYLVPSYLPRSLVHLVLVGNNIERIPGYVFAHMDPGIEYLYLSYNKLDGEAIEPESFFGSYQSMVELCLDHNQLVSIPSGINEMTNLHFLRLNDNNIRYETNVLGPLPRNVSRLSWDFLP